MFRASFGIQPLRVSVWGVPSLGFRVEVWHLKLSTLSPQTIPKLERWHMKMKDITQQDFPPTFTTKVPSPEGSLDPQFPETL